MINCIAASSGLDSSVPEELSFFSCNPSTSLKKIFKVEMSNSLSAVVIVALPSLIEFTSFAPSNNSAIRIGVLKSSFIAA